MSEELLSAEGLRHAHLGPVSIALREGECVALSGPSGAGKTLLLRALADLDSCQGALRLRQEPLEAVPPVEWRRRVSFLPAESAWWAEVVGEHFGTPPAVDPSELGFAPEVMNWNVAHLSSGERQRLGLLRLMEQRPDVLLLDEPTANLDEENTLRVEALVRAYLQVRSAAAIWVGHDPRQRERVGDRELEMASGRLLARGDGGWT